MTASRLLISASCLLLIGIGSKVIVGDDTTVQESPPTPAGLRAEAEKLDGYALNAVRLRIGDDSSLPPAVAVDLAKSYRQEADIREQAQELLEQADRLREAGKHEEAARRRQASDEKRIQAEALAAERLAERRLQDQQSLLRDSVLSDSKRAGVLRLEGRPAEAAVIESKVDRQLRAAGYDRNVQQANQLKTRAVEARLERRYDDADLFEREAERLLGTATDRAGSSIRESGIRGGEARRHEQDHSHLTHDELFRLRQDVDRLAKQVARLSEAVESLRKQAQ